MMRDKIFGRRVYIQESLRSPIGVYKGQFEMVRPEHLGAAVLKEMCTENLDGLLVGNAVGTGGNIGRLLSLYSGIPEIVPAITIDMQCASGLASIGWAFANIKSGIGHHYIGGGIESSSLQPLRTYHELDNRKGSYLVAQFTPYTISSMTMIEGAERVAQVEGFSRNDLDSWALYSHKRASEISKKGLLKACVCSELSSLQEIIESDRENYTDPSLDGLHRSKGFDEKKYIDEGIRHNISERLLGRMPLLLGENTLTTAGNACLTHDGVAFINVTSEPSDFEIIHITSWGGSSEMSPKGALGATEKVLKEAGLTIQDIDAIEWNEAFAVLDCIFEKNYPNYVDRYNSWGGALAYGHPFGASGAIITGHLMERLRYEKKQFGLVAIAGAGGTGMAMIIEYNPNRGE